MSELRRPGGSAPPPLPEGFGVVLVESGRWLDGNRIVLGGAPFRLLRLAPAGAAAVGRWRAGGTVASRAEGVLARRLIDAGLARPVAPEANPDAPAGLAAQDPLAHAVVVIPVHDDPRGLRATLAALRPRDADLPRPAGVVIVDDASPVPVAPEDLQPIRTAPDGPHGPAVSVVVLRNDAAQGPGPARQRGWTSVVQEEGDPLATTGQTERTAPGPARRPEAAVAPPAVRLAAAPAKVSQAAGPCTGSVVPGAWSAAGHPTADLTAFVDAGVVLTAQDLARLVRHFADPAVAAVAPRVLPRPPDTAMSAALWAYEEHRSPLDLGPVSSVVRPGAAVPYVPTAALVVRTSALAAIDGFDPALRYGEDVDLVWRLVAAGGTVLYDATVTATHPVRATLAAVARQRYAYGTSATALAQRHGSAVAPVAVNPWTAAAWALAAIGHPALGATIAAGSTAALVPRLADLPGGRTEAIRLAGWGHLRAAGALATATRRTWWPLAAALALVSRRSRPVLAAAFVLPPLWEWTQRKPRLHPLRWLALRLVDDLAYGTGVWRGALSARSGRALLPMWSGRVAARRTGRRRHLARP